MGDFGFPDQNLPLDGQRKRPNGRRAGPNAILRRAPAISASGTKRKWRGGPTMSAVEGRTDLPI
jgi:hypothetical protein